MSSDDPSVTGARPSLRRRRARPNADGDRRGLRGAAGTARPHVAALDGIRGLAIAIVVLHHLKLPHVRGGWIGVEIFFVLSGFLITTTVISQDGRRMSDFLRRRFWRLAPALVLFLAWFTLASASAPDRRFRFEAALAAAGQVINLTQAGSRHGPFSPHVGHLWSLAAEAQFYLAWPVVLAWLLRRRTSRTRILVGVSVALVASAVLRWALVSAGMSWNRLYYAPDTRAAGFLAGCLVGLLFGWGAFRRSPLLAPAARLLTVPSLLAVAAYVWFGPHFTDPAVYRWQLTALTIAGGVLVASGAAAQGGLARPLLESRPLVWLGDISYSLYLWHVPVIAIVVSRRPEISAAGKAAVVVPVSLLVAWVSFHLVERPWMSSSRRRALLQRPRERRP